MDGGQGDGKASDTGDGGSEDPSSDPDDSDTVQIELVSEDPRSDELREAEADLAAAEDALAEAESSDDDLLEELLELLWEITGGADIERCFTEGDIGSCIMAAIGLIPWGKLLKVGSKIPKMWRLFDRWRDSRRLRNTRRANVEDARTRRNNLCRVGNSFPAGTPVLLGDGSYLPIEDIDPGEEVYAFDPLTAEEGAREVTALSTSDGARTLVTVEIRGAYGTTATVVATDDHPFWAPEHATWVNATDLVPGTSLRTPSGEWAEVTETDTWTATDQEVHNLTVAGVHTFYVGVGETDVLVHNQQGCGDDLGDDWTPRPASEICDSTGCEAVARDIQGRIGGDIYRINPPGTPRHGTYRGQDTNWAHHEVVIKDGRVYDAFSPRDGVPIREYEQLWDPPISLPG